MNNGNNNYQYDYNKERFDKLDNFNNKTATMTIIVLSIVGGIISIIAMICFYNEIGLGVLAIPLIFGLIITLIILIILMPINKGLA